MSLPDNLKRGYIEVDLSAIQANVHNLHSLYPSHTGIMAVIKADAYGHGSVRVGLALEEMDIVYGFSVATSEEAFELRLNGIKKPILVMGAIFPSEFERLLKDDISIILFNDETYDAVNECAARLNQKVSVHIEVDTGMNRVGIKPDEAGFSFMEKIATNPLFDIDGIYTHFARADELDKSFTHTQIEKYCAFIDLLENELGLGLRNKHSSNSAGMIGFSNTEARTRFGICRPGIAIYGIWPSTELKMETREFEPGLTLKPAMSLYSQIIMLKTCPPGEAISYGGTFVTERETLVATVPVGYGDGYPHSLSNNGYVLVRGNKTPILGRVCMDFFMIDVTDVPDVNLGDKVTLIGKDGDLQITVEDLTEISGRFHYELVCGLSNRLKRVYKQ